MDYLEFLREKIGIAPETGFSVCPEEVNPALKPHQRDGFLWAVRVGRRALFEAFGLGKTVPEVAVKKGRYGWGIELNPDYFRDGVAYLESAEAQIGQPTLFDFMEGAG